MLDTLFLWFKAFVEDLVEPLFRFEMREGSWYRKETARASHDGV